LVPTPKPSPSTSTKEGGLSHGKVCRVFQAAFGIPLSRGGSVQVILRAGERCSPQYREILLYVRQSAVSYADETGWRVGGVLWWLWAFVTTAAPAPASNAPTAAQSHTAECVPLMAAVSRLASLLG